MAGLCHQRMAAAIGQGFREVAFPLATSIENSREPNTRKQPDVLFYALAPNGQYAPTPCGIVEISDSQSLSSLLRRCNLFMQRSPTVNFAIGLKVWDHGPDRMICVVYGRDGNGQPAPLYGYSFGPHAEYLQRVTDDALQAAGFLPGTPGRWSGVESFDAVCSHPGMPRYALPLDSSWFFGNPAAAAAAMAPPAFVLDLYSVQRAAHGFAF
ncbi:hypothetical protein SELMODRAFT_416032 [Selaginella moellendorffii]|uniref:Uncharacterized protein n=1 Tax=Selaginella moellendorffii TaxID=88036 RepID=D8RXV2_SELML|nr:hypothetical protein SELMODRAFT_416032 [Selaginella moellendorffii]